MAIELYREEIKGLPQNYDRYELPCIAIRQVEGENIFLEAFNSFMDAFEVSKKYVDGHVAYLLEDGEEPEYISDDWDDELEPDCLDLGFDPYEGCYTFDC